MVKHKMEYADFEKLLLKQITLLIDLCQQFDSGKYDYADVIATKIVAIINFQNRDSILPNMGKQMTMRFCSTSKVVDSTENVVLYRSLIASRYNGKYSYFPKFDFSSYPNEWVGFEKWVRSPIYIYNAAPDQELDGLIYIHEISESTQIMINREDVIRFYRNKIGGAHSDEKVDKRMYAISEGLSSIEFSDHPSTAYSVGEKYRKGQPFEFMFEMTIRQIAHELILSIKREFNLPVRYKPLYTDYVNKRPRELKDFLVTISHNDETGERQLHTKEI